MKFTTILIFQVSQGSAADISIGHQVVASKRVVPQFCMRISNKKGNLTQLYTIDKSICDILVFQIYETYLK